MTNQDKGASPLKNEEKFVERLKKKTPQQLMRKLLLCDSVIFPGIIDKMEDDDPRKEKTRALYTRQRELIVAEINRRKAAGFEMPAATIQAKSVKMGSSARMG